MINAIVVDDEALGREMILSLLKTHCPQVNVVAECETASSAQRAIKEHQPQLVFLDIALPGESGFDLLKSLGTINFEVIFVTAHDQYVLKALRFNAVDYLLKPVDEQELQQAVQKVIDNQFNASEKLNIHHLVEQHFSPPKKADSLCVPTSKGFRIIKLDDIVCCEANNTYTIMHLLDHGQITSTKPLADYDLTLSDSGFTRVHKSWLINMKHVKEYTRGEGGTVLLSNNRLVDVARRKKDSFLSELKKVFKF